VAIGRTDAGRRDAMGVRGGKEQSVGTAGLYQDPLGGQFSDTFALDSGARCLRLRAGMRAHNQVSRREFIACAALLIASSRLGKVARHYAA
jgi:hypothetical protein